MQNTPSPFNKRCDFFIVGAPKAGTTSLYSLFNRHPQIQMSEIKEPNFFSSQSLKRQNLYYKEKIIDTLENYHALFNWREKKIRGEASVSYLYYPDVPSGIHIYNPAAKIIVILRNPVERAFSHYLMDKRLGFVKLPFEEIFIKSSRHLNADQYFQQFFELGLYAAPLKNYFKIFDASQIAVILFEELITDPAGIAKKLFSFLGVNEWSGKIEFSHKNKSKVISTSFFQQLYRLKSLRKFVKSILPKSLEPVVNRMFFSTETEVISTQMQKKLIEFYLNDIMTTEQITGKNLQSWLIPDDLIQP